MSDLVASFCQTVLVQLEADRQLEADPKARKATTSSKHGVATMSWTDIVKTLADESDDELSPIPSSWLDADLPTKDPDEQADSDLILLRNALHSRRLWDLVSFSRMDRV